MVKMSIDAHDKCSKVIRFLRFNWIRNPEIVLSEKIAEGGSLQPPHVAM